MAYQYDAFYSYKRDRRSDGWHEVLKDKLEFWIQSELNQMSVNIYFDTQDVETGDQWYPEMKEALRTSKCLICLWSPQYFLSKWCVSEWKTFETRRELTGKSLVLPAKYCDGQHFPSEANKTQFMDFSPFTSTSPHFWDSKRAMEFEDDLIRKFAVDAAAKIASAPELADFPVIEADAVKVAPIGRMSGG